MRVTPILLLVASLCSAANLPAQQDRTARGTRTSTGPSIDGRLEEGVWGSTPPLSGFVQREPREGQAVSERTGIRILYDDDALYIGAWMYDRNPSAIVFGQTLRDASLNDADAFLMVLDTYRDQQNGFVFGTTPAGIEYDGQISNEGQGGGGGGGRQQRGSGGGFNLNWDGSWQVGTSRDESGW